MLAEMEAIADDPEGYMNGKVSGEDYMEYVRNRMDGRMDSGFGSGYGRPTAPKAPVRPAGGGVSPAPAPRPASTGPKHYEPGDIVEHKVFGRGEVLKVKPAAGDQIVEIRFEKVGVKKTMANYAPLVKITTEE